MIYKNIIIDFYRLKRGFIVIALKSRVIYYLNIYTYIIHIK